MATGEQQNSRQLQRSAWLPERFLRRNTSAELIHALFEGNPDMVIVADEEQRIIAANSRALAEFGYLREEIDGRPIHMLLPEEGRERHAGHVRAFLSRPLARPMGSGMDLNGRDAQGRTFPVDVMLWPFRIDGRGYVLAICRRPDVALAHTRMQMNALVENVRDYAITLFDAEGCVLTWNEGARRIHGLSSAEAMGQHISIVFLPEDAARCGPERLLREAAETGHCHTTGWRLGAGGRKIWVQEHFTSMRDASGRLTGFTRVLQDLTVRREVEEAMQRLNAQLEQYRIIVENVDEYAMYTLDPNGYITSWNPGAQRAGGYSADDVIGKHYTVFGAPEEAEKGDMARELEEAARTGRSIGEGWRVAKDGSIRWWSGVITALRDPEGRLTGFIRVCRDATPRKELEDSMARMNAELEQKVAERTKELEATVAELRRKNEEVENFSRIVSHDLKEKEVLLKEIHHRVKNNLQVVQSLLKMSARKLSDCDARIAVESTVERVHAMSMVHERLYQMPNLSAVPLASYLSDIFGGAIQAYSLAPSQVRLKLDVDEIQLPLDRAVPFALLANELLSNCFKHGFPGDRKGTITVSIHRVDGAVNMVIEDDGVGLPPDFDARNSNSMGLKLAMNLAHQLGGRLEFSSNHGCRVAGEFTRV